MTKCPQCGKWTMDFDDYFGRFRCFDQDCGWMAASSAEREIRLIKTQKRPQLLCEQKVEELGIILTCAYDAENDALLFDFGADEPTFDLPEPDGRMVWKIGYRSSSVGGFIILAATRLGVSQVQVNILGRKERIERKLKTLPDAIAAGRATRMLIERVIVGADQDEPWQHSYGLETTRETRTPLQKAIETLTQRMSTYEMNKDNCFAI